MPSNGKQSSRRVAGAQGGEDAGWLHLSLGERSGCQARERVAEPRGITLKNLAIVPSPAA